MKRLTFSNRITKIIHTVPFMAMNTLGFDHLQSRPKYFIELENIKEM